MSTIETDTPFLGGRDEPIPERPVHDLRSDDVIARFQRRLEQRRRRRHARREQKRRLAAFECREHGFGLVVGRIVGARIVAARTILVVLVALIGRRHVNGRRNRARGRLNPAQALGCDGFGGEFVVVAHF
jgi:hypothetical protein